MDDFTVDIATQDACLVMSPDGVHTFRIASSVRKSAIPSLIWGAALLYIPFFSGTNLIRFTLHQAGRPVRSLMGDHEPIDAPSLCQYIGRKMCLTYGEDPRHELCL